MNCLRCEIFLGCLRRSAVWRMGMDGALMGFEQEAVSELYASVWGNRSTMQREFTRGAHGEQFVLRELSMKGTQTPSQLASALQASSGRISTVLSSLEKKGWVTRDIDSKDRRIIRVNLTDSGREQSHRMIEEMRSAICWIFSQMGGSGARANSLTWCLSSPHICRFAIRGGLGRRLNKCVRHSWSGTSAWLNTWQLSARRTNRQG